MNNLDNIWIALAHVKPRRGFENILDGNVGAFLNIVGKASNPKVLKKLTDKAFFNAGFMLQEDLKDVELLSERLKKFNVDQDILDLVNNINENYPVQFGIFDTYPEKNK